MITGRFFLDTAYVIALLNLRDSYHKKARIWLPRIRSAREIWTTEAVLAEIGNSLARSNRSAAAAFINSCYVTLNVRVVTVDRVLFRRGVEFYHSRNDKEWGVTDCISFIVMQDYGLVEALTTDEHFQQAGFRAILLEEA